MRRLSWEEYFMTVTLDVAKRSSCLSRQVGAIIVKDKRILATGYNGSPKGINTCYDKGFCIRKNSESGQNLDTCYAVHSEMNAILQCAKNGVSCDGDTLYVTTFPCVNCMKAIINSGIVKVIYYEDYNAPLSKELAKLSGIELIDYNNIEGDDK